MKLRVWEYLKTVSENTEDKAHAYVAMSKIHFQAVYLSIKKIQKIQLVI